MRRIGKIFGSSVKVLAPLLLLAATPLAAKDKAAAALPPLPGELRSGSGGAQIFLEKGRSLLWSEQGQLSLRDAKKAVLAEVSLSDKAAHESGAEAMGLAVEETDLGGSMSSKKKYLSGKKAPTGRRLAAGSVGGAPLEGGNEQKSVVDGIPMTWISYSNGSSLWRIQWPDREEELFFDRKRTLIYNQQTRKQGPFAVTLKQFADGSYQRYFQRDSGEVQVIFDTGDTSYRVAFLNAKGEVLRELDCAETCD
ncbi:MAG TPA: hypothetical protein VJR29_10810 [bacterium]|nr:hypothetical protein [bacterium]